MGVTDILIIFREYFFENLIRVTVTYKNIVEGHGQCQTTIYRQQTRRHINIKVEVCSMLAKLSGVNLKKDFERI